LALALPRRGLGGGLGVFLVAWPLAVPQGVADLLRVEGVPRLLHRVAEALAQWSGSAWTPSPALVDYAGYVAIDVWRFTPMVALLCAFALRRSDDLTVAAAVDGLSAWQRLLYVHWPRMRAACGLAVVIRAVDTLAAWPHPGSAVSLAAWARDAAQDGAGVAAAVVTALCLLLLALIPARPLRAPSGGRR
jgi:ABC-type sugar transport system permease subunit